MTTDRETCPRVPRGALLVAWTLIVLAATFAGYQQLFSTFSQYDDEGYVMISLQSFLDGQPLYDKTFTQYGPAYYFLHGGLHQGLSLPITHEVTRFKTLLLWLATAGMSSLFVFRVTRAHTLALTAFAAVFLHLDKLPLETGHPQEQCVLFIACALIASTWRMPRATDQGPKTWLRFALPVVFGILCGLVTMTKINVGVLLSVATFTGFVILVPPTRLRTGLLAGSSAVSLLLPLLLFRDHLLDFEANVLPLVTVASLAGVLLAARRFSNDLEAPFGLRGLAYFVMAWVITTASIAIAALCSGTTPNGLLYGLVGQHAGFADVFFHPPALRILAIPAAVGIVCVAFAPRGFQDRCFGWCRVAAIGLAVSCSVAYVFESVAPPVHGMQERGAMWRLASFAPALMYLLLIAPTNTNVASTMVARITLAFTAILLPLSMFPTPGTQVATGTFPLLLGCLILAHDALASWRSQETDPSLAIWSRRVAIAMPSLLVVALLCRDVGIWQYRSTLSPLALSGTGPLLLPADAVNEHRQVIATLRAHAAPFVFADHGYNSLYFWAAIKPPTPLNATFGRYLLRPDQQREIIASLERNPQACVIREAADFKLRRGPLIEYVEQEFEPAHTIGGWQMWVRKIPTERRSQDENEEA
jgi:hypothetical protein